MWRFPVVFIVFIVAKCAVLTFEMKHHFVFNYIANTVLDLTVTPFLVAVSVGAVAVLAGIIFRLWTFLIAAFVFCVPDVMLMCSDFGVTFPDWDAAYWVLNVTVALIASLLILDSRDMQYLRTGRVIFQTIFAAAIAAGNYGLLLFYLSPYFMSDSEMWAFALAAGGVLGVTLVCQFAHEGTAAIYANAARTDELEKELVVLKARLEKDKVKPVAPPAPEPAPGPAELTGAGLVTASG
jgi:hypothetical protein